MTVKVTVSISPELDAALDCVAASTQMSKSRTVEVYLREHPQIAKFVKLVRAEPDTAVFAASPRRERKPPPKRVTAKASA